jgi:hypothetical protein
LTFNPQMPSVQDMVLLGTVIAAVAAAWSDGSLFTGTLTFGSPYADDGGTFALSCQSCTAANIVVSWALWVTAALCSRSGGGCTMRRGTLPASVYDSTVMREAPVNSPFPNGEHYRELAIKLCELARLCRFAYGRKELLQLAVVFRRRADHFDRQALEQSMQLDLDGEEIRAAQSVD